jgi:hypothetical protein
MKQAKTEEDRKGLAEKLKDPYRELGAAMKRKEPESSAPRVADGAGSPGNRSAGNGPDHVRRAAGLSAGLRPL